MFTRYAKRLALALCIAMGGSRILIYPEPSILGTEFDKLGDKAKFSRLMKLKMELDKARRQARSDSLAEEKKKADSLQELYEKHIQALQESTHIKDLQRIINQYIMQEKTTWCFAHEGKLYLITNDNDEFKVDQVKHFSDLPSFKSWSIYTPEAADQDDGKFTYKIIRALMKPKQEVPKISIARSGTGLLSPIPITDVVAQLTSGQIVTISFKNNQITGVVDKSKIYEKIIQECGETLHIKDLDKLVDKCIEDKNPVFSSGGKSYQIFGDDEGRFGIYDALPSGIRFRYLQIQADLGKNTAALIDLEQPFIDLMKQEDFFALPEDRKIFLGFFVEKEQTEAYGDQEEPKIVLLTKKDGRTFFVGDKDGKLAVSSMDKSIALVNKKLATIFSKLEPKEKTGTFRHNGQTWTIIKEHNERHNILEGPDLNVRNWVGIDYAAVPEIREHLKSMLKSERRASIFDPQITHGTFFAINDKGKLFLMQKDSDKDIYCVDLHHTRINKNDCIKMFQDLNQKLQTRGVSDEAIDNELNEILKMTKPQDHEFDQHIGYVDPYTVDDWSNIQH